MAGVTVGSLMNSLEEHGAEARFVSPANRITSENR